MSAIPPIHNVKWESLPVSLKPPIPTTAQKIGRLAWNILSILIPIIGLARLGAYTLGVLSRRLLLPAAYYDAKEAVPIFCRDRFQKLCEFRSNHFEIIPTTVVTPDGAALSATLFRHRNGNGNTPTAIYFQGNGSLKGMGSWDWILQESIDKRNPINLVLFDYRSVDQSTGTSFTRPKDLVVDGASIVDWVRNVLKTPDDRIHFYGLSLGGAVSVKTKAAFDELNGWIVNERSFSSLEEWIRAHAVNLPWLLKPLSSLAIWILKNQELELNVAADLEKLKGRKLIVYHLHDPVIPYGASTARHFPKHAFQLREHVSVENHHCSDLNDYHDGQETVARFIFA